MVLHTILNKPLLSWIESFSWKSNDIINFINHQNEKAAKLAAFSIEIQFYVSTLKITNKIYLLSKIKVTGPTFVNWTSIIAPNIPVSTLIPFSFSFSLKYSYKLFA